MKKIFILFILLVSMISCNPDKTLEDARMIKLGMSSKELKYVMGEPFLVRIGPNKEEWYFNYTSESHRVGLEVIMVHDTILNYSSY
jgi:outer membrane protein assembly factor BamE (lipoprotein component of BamABCDE complex)